MKFAILSFALLAVTQAVLPELQVLDTNMKRSTIKTSLKLTENALKDFGERNGNVVCNDIKIKLAAATNKENWTCIIGENLEYRVHCQPDSYILMSRGGKMIALFRQSGKSA